MSGYRYVVKVTENTLPCPKICRACLTIKTNHCYTSLFQKIILDEAELVIAEILTSCANVQIVENDDLPQDICESCVHNAVKSYNFRLQVESSDETLRNNQISSSIINDFPVVNNNSGNENKLLGDECFIPNIPEEVEKEENGSSNGTQNDPINQLAEEAVPNSIPSEEMDFQPPQENYDLFDGQIKFDGLDQTSSPIKDKSTTLDKVTALSQPPLKTNLLNAFNNTYIEFLTRNLERNIPDLSEMSDESFECSSALEPPPKKKRRGKRGAKKLKCKICSVFFRTQKDLKNHKKVHVDAPIKFNCQTCNTQFSDEELLNSHLASMHPNVKDMNSNQLCNEDRTQNSLEDIQSSDNNLENDHCIIEEFPKIGPHISPSPEKEPNVRILSYEIFRNGVNDLSATVDLPRSAPNNNSNATKEPVIRIIPPETPSQHFPHSDYFPRDIKPPPTISEIPPVMKSNTNEELNQMGIYEQLKYDDEMSEISPTITPETGTQKPKEEPREEPNVMEMQQIKEHFTDEIPENELLTNNDGPNVLNIQEQIRRIEEKFTEEMAKIEEITNIEDLDVIQAQEENFSEVEIGLTSENDKETNDMEKLHEVKNVTQEVAPLIIRKSIDKPRKTIVMRNSPQIKNSAEKIAEMEFMDISANKKEIDVGSVNLESEKIPGLEITEKKKETKAEAIFPKKLSRTVLIPVRLLKTIQTNDNKPSVSLMEEKTNTKKESQNLSTVKPRVNPSMKPIIASKSIKSNTLKEFCQHKTIQSTEMIEKIDKSEDRGEDARNSISDLENNHVNQIERFNEIEILEEECIQNDEYLDEYINISPVSRNRNSIQSHTSANDGVQKQAQNRTKNRYKICGICGGSFKKGLNLSNHLKLHNSKKLYSCKRCGELFPSSRKLKLHQRTHGWKYECKTCNECFNWYSSYFLHVSSHVEKCKKFECSYCHQEFQTELLLQKHLEIHVLQKVYACDVCKKMFKRSLDLESHKEICTQKEMVKCLFCAFTAETPEKLTYHVKYSHKFAINSSLTHENQVQSSTSSSFHCSCGKFYKSKPSLTRHKKKSMCH